MSEYGDDQDIGIEDMDGMDGMSGLSGGNSDNKRALHNAMERKRRDSIKDSFRGLQECIPTLRGDKTSRAQVLKKTGDYISQMQNKIAKHQTEIEDLRKQNSQLEVQIRSLEKTSFGSSNGGGLLSNNENIMATQLDLNAQDIIFENGEEVAVYEDSPLSSTPISDIAVNPLNQINLVGNGGRSVVKTISGVTLAPNSAAYSSNGVSLASKSVTVSLAPATQTVTIQPGQSVLQNNIRLQRGQSLLLSEPMRKKKRMN
jgi:Max protein